MPLSYLDQNALIALGVKARKPEFREKLNYALESGALSVVVSTWHLIEAANTRNIESAIELAEFIDSLRPAWLMERRDAQRFEVEELPTLAIETAISEHEWVSQGGADRNTLIDKFHLISALPYVDEIISNDKFFHEVYPWAQKTGHVQAKLLGNDHLLNRF
jgi:hypothetical protein